MGIGQRQIYPFILSTETEQDYRSEQCSLFVLEDFLYYQVKLDIAPTCAPEFAISGIDIEYQMLTPTKWLLRHRSTQLQHSSIPFIEVFVGDPEFPYAKLGEFNPIYCLMGFWTEAKKNTRLWKTTLRVPGDALRKSTIIYSWFELVEGKDIASALFHYLPDWLYFRDEARLIFEPTANNRLEKDSLEKLSVVRWWNNHWFYVPSELKGRQITTKVRALGSFALKYDFQPPTADTISTSADTILIYIQDDLSGFGIQNLPQVYIDEKWALCEYDYEDNTITVLPKESIDVGEHKLKLVAKDRANNKLEKEWDFQIK